MTTNRKQPDRAHRPITPEAIELYRNRDKLGLHSALGLQPWQVSPLDALGAQPPAWCPPGDGWRRSWAEGRALRHQLEAARHADE